MRPVIELEYILGVQAGEEKVEAGKCPLKYLHWQPGLGNQTGQAGVAAVICQQIAGIHSHCAINTLTKGHNRIWSAGDKMELHLEYGNSAAELLNLQYGDCRHLQGL